VSPFRSAVAAPGAPRTPAVAKRLERYNTVVQPVLLLAAVLPIILGLVERDAAGRADQRRSGNSST
jgi:hypothetical protein